MCSNPKPQIRVTKVTAGAQPPPRMAFAVAQSRCHFCHGSDEGTINTQDIWNFITTQGVDFGIKPLTAIVAWIIGRWLINLAVGLIGKGFERGGKIDATLAHYLKSIIAIVLNIVMILAILDIFGIRTTSFAALLAGAGLAIGAAWSGMLGNSAAGVFMQVLRPYKVGDFIQAGG